MPSYAERHSVTVTTDASGDATAYVPSSGAITGRIASIQYVKTDYANGVDFAITLEATGQGLWTESDVNAAKTVAPRQPTHSQAGVAALYAAGGTAVGDHIVAANDRVKIVVAQGGATKVGQFIVTVV